MNVGQPETLRAARQRSGRRLPALKERRPDRGKLSARTGSLHPQWRACRQTPAFAASPATFSHSDIQAKRSAELGVECILHHPHSEIGHDPNRAAGHDEQNKAGKQDELEVIHFLPWRIDVEKEPEMNDDLD